MPTVPEVELEQKAFEFMEFARNFADNKKQDWVFHGRNGSFKISLFDGDITLEFRK